METKMERFGRVLRLELDSKSGVILDFKGKEFFFSAIECEGEAAPAVGTKVSFFKDEDFSTPVAVCVKPVPVQKV
jgi:hypothetical protein